MEVQLDKLIERIKNEGIDSANGHANEIIEKARMEAVSIIEKAKSDAEEMKIKSKKESENFQVNTENSIRQASRDTVLVLRNKILEMFDKALSKQVSIAFNEAFMKDLILKIVSNWTEGKNIEVVAGSIDVEKLKQMLVGELKRDAIVKLDNKIGSGFRISVQGDSISYDITDEAIIEALKVFLNPKIAELLG
ncbi:MAG: hypothetical protein A2Y40_00085 [Candidatus Margulisbacteria bacterium GWF2_35_9]|nr:MAG: hypothetical protein A2Y40_00085 [Candidatus Margulisbacteria bacterium GWF2_35_9]